MNERKKAKLRGKLATFVRQYRRRKGRGRCNQDPNDRTYDREIEEIVKRMKPEDLDELMRDGDDG
jgi:hypothetical protein